MAQLTQDQLKANIDALTKQGAPHDVIQSYLDSLKTQAAPPAKKSSTGVPGVGAPLSPLGVGAGFAKGAVSMLQGADVLGGMNKMVGKPGDFTGMTWAQRDAATAPTTKSEQVGSQLATVASLAVPMDIGVAKTAGAAADVLKGTGAAIGKYFVPKSMAEAKQLQTYRAGNSLFERMKGLLGFSETKAPPTAASAAFDRGVAGPESIMGVKAKKVQTKLWDSYISPALKQSDTRVQMPDFFAQAEQKIVQENPDPTRRNSLMNALSAIKEDFGAVKNINMEQLQEYKKGWAEWVPEKAYKGESISAAVNDVRNTLAGMARAIIHNDLGDNVKQAYLDYGNLDAIKTLGQKAMTGAIKGGTGTTLKNLLEKATVPIGTLAGQTIYKVAEGVEFVGKSGIATLGALLGISQGTAQSPASTATPASPASLPLQTVSPQQLGQQITSPPQQ